MSYYGNQQSKVNIYYGLVERGWKCYGFKADESDSMTDYFSPAHWDGIAEKDGYILLVDVYGTRSSGYQKKERTFTADYSKIKKLETLRDDKAATEGEKQACQIQIDKLLQKEKESTIIVEQYPTWKHGNPKRNNWHIEKDGEIIAKGNGAFQCDGHLFGNSEKETMEKVNKFLDRIESFINGNEQLEKVIIKQVKKVIKPVEVTDRKTIEVGDVLTFDYHGHYWEVISINTRKDEKVTATYEILGKASRGYQRLKNANRYYDYMNKLEKNIEEGKIKIYKLQEVEEVTEKVTYKKTTRKRKAQDENLLQGETIEQTENTVKNENKEPETQEQIKPIATYSINEEHNGIEIKLSEKPSEEVRKELKQHGFRWHSVKFVWFAKNTPERLQYVLELTQQETESNEEPQNEQNEVNNTEVFEAQETTQESEINESYNNIDPIIIPEMNEELNLQYFSTAPTQDDIFAAFEDIDLSKGEKSIITPEDKKHCEELEQQFNEYKITYETFIDQIEAIKPHNKYMSKSDDVGAIKKRIEDRKNSFLADVLNYFKDKYSIKIDYWELEKKYDNKPITLDIILDEIILLLDGLTFAEMEAQQVKNDLKNDARYEKVTVKTNKLTIGSFFFVSCDQWSGYKLDYGQYDKVEHLIKAIAHYNNVNYVEFADLEKTIKHEYNDKVFTSHEIGLNKINSIKLYKNGRVDIEFKTSKDAQQFNNGYLQK